MLKPGGELDLATEAFCRELPRELRREDLHHHVPAKRNLACDEHARHPATTELAIYGLGGSECFLEMFAKV
ncbi:MAG: hypothetical protein H0T21_04620 [Gemmatimonadaceae bacterium]|nr:hypothetical protein [Gemmatimonadaceae bacterium]